MMSGRIRGYLEEGLPAEGLDPGADIPNTVGCPTGSRMTRYPDDTPVILWL